MLASLMSSFFSMPPLLLGLADAAAVAPRPPPPAPAWPIDPRTAAPLLLLLVLGWVVLNAKAIKCIDGRCMRGCRQIIDVGRMKDRAPQPPQAQDKRMRTLILAVTASCTGAAPWHRRTMSIPATLQKKTAKKMDRKSVSAENGDVCTVLCVGCTTRAAAGDALRCTHSLACYWWPVGVVSYAQYADAVFFCPHLIVRTMHCNCISYSTADTFPHQQEALHVGNCARECQEPA